jgi:hypothetical protein
MRKMTGLIVVIGGMLVGVPVLAHVGAGARTAPASVRPVVAPYHQESSIRAVHTAHGYHVIARSR